jgi:hypothetical protein
MRKPHAADVYPIGDLPRWPPIRLPVAAAILKMPARGPKERPITASKGFKVKRINRHTSRRGSGRLAGWLTGIQPAWIASVAARGVAVRKAVLGLLMLPVLVSSLGGCAAALGAALAAGEIRQGVAGVQDLISGARRVSSDGITLPPDLATPLAGTYRGFQALGSDTVHYFIRTMDRPTIPILDLSGNVTGYVLPGIAATSLDTLEARVRQWSVDGSEGRMGRAMFFVEATGMPDPNVRTLYPSAFLGRVAPGESRSADRQHEELRRRDVQLDTPSFEELAGRGIPHEGFNTVAEGIFTLRPGGEAFFRQEYRMDDGRTLVLHFERISATTLPNPQ